MSPLTRSSTDTRNKCMPRPAGFRKRGAQAASGAYAQPVSPGLMILIAGGLLALAIGATLVAGRLRVPGLLLFLGLGMAVGGHGIGWIDLNNVRLARTIGVIALSLILFEGGLAAGFREVRPVLSTGILLAGPGTVITAVVTGLVAERVVGLSLLEGLLLGSI